MKKSNEENKINKMIKILVPMSTIGVIFVVLSDMSKKVWSLGWELITVKYPFLGYIIFGLIVINVILLSINITIRYFDQVSGERNEE